MTMTAEPDDLVCAVCIIQRDLCVNTRVGRTQSFSDPSNLRFVVDLCLCTQSHADTFLLHENVLKLRY